MSDVQAIEVFRLAPLCARRDMAMLGALHKISLGTAPKQLSEMFPVFGAPRDISHWRLRDLIYQGTEWDHGVGTSFTKMPDRFCMLRHFLYMR